MPDLRPRLREIEGEALDVAVWMGAPSPALVVELRLEGVDPLA